MKNILLLGVAMLLMNDKPAYQIYDQQLKTTGYEQLLAKAAQSDVILFGELHNNPIAHWLQLELTNDLYEQKKQALVLGGEMFEADNQLVVSEYVEGKITAAQLEAEAKMWPNFRTDYKPLVDFAREHSVPFIASNIPRRYASIVAKKGTDGLNELTTEAKKNIAPLPMAFDGTLPGYASMLNMGGGHGSSMSGENMAKAQAIKDATMAHFIQKNTQSGKVFLHFNGTYHSQNFEGIVWYLKKANPSLKILTIATVEEKNIGTPQEAKANLANFIVAVPESMTKTH